MVHTDTALDKRLHAIITARRVPGAGFVVFGPDRPTTVAVAGRRRASAPDPVRPTDRWHLGSVAKSMTATMIARLHERGVLDLCESVMSGLTGTPAERHADARHFNAVTIADLLAHRSGMRANPTYALLSRYVLFGEEPHRTNAAALQQSLTRGIGPGGAYRYSNSGYGVAGLIAAHRTGRTWQQLIQEHIRDALEIPGFGFGRPEWYGAHPWGHRRRYVRSGYTDATINKRGLDLDIMRPAGDVHASLEGLAHYGNAHLAQLAGGDGPLLGADLAARLYAPVGDSMDPRRGGSYALGWHVEESARDFGGQRMLWHNGSDLFSFAMLGLLPESGVGFAWVTNALQRDWHDDTSLVWQPVSALVAEAT
jgi:CubicO group peptidase (beta-lactamase class C family)